MCVCVCVREREREREREGGGTSRLQKDNECLTLSNSQTALHLFIQKLHAIRQLTLTYKHFIHVFYTLISIMILFIHMEIFLYR